MIATLVLAACAEAALNYCSPLVPTPDLDSVSATVQLMAPSGPFAVPLTRDGVLRYALAIEINGLPEPSSLGAYTVYVAWATSLSMDSVVKLGVVGNGERIFNAIDRNQFRVLVSAERSPAVRAREGRLVLRGTSPTVRLLMHRDFMTPFAPGAAIGSGMMMLGVPPDASFLPGDPGNLPEALPQQTVSLHDGDTLSLVAMRLRHTIAGQSFVGYGYNGQYPGPLLTVPQGSHVFVRFENRTDQPTTVHWHGLRLENVNDGAAGLTQDAVAPGGAYTYALRFPDAGMFWYHAHEREDVQLGLGLYGTILVTRGQPPVNEQVPLTLQDILMASRQPVAFGADGPTHALMGRFGNTFLVNGRTRYALSVHEGAVVRFLIANVSNARTYNLAFGNVRVKLVGSDLGEYEHDTWATNILIAPAERYVVDLQFDRPGTVAIMNRIQALDHRFGVFSPEVDTLGVVHVDSQPAVPRYDFEHLERRGGFDQYRASVNRPADHTLFLEMRVHNLPAPITNMFTGASVPVDMNDGMMGMNGLTTSREVTWILRDSATGAENMDIHWHFHAGTTPKIRIVNDPIGPHPMAHPIHLHGQRMLLVSRNGVPVENLVWKDTILVPAGEADDVLFDLSNPGTWMLHCHIAEHRGSGMMTALVVDSAP